MTLILGGMTLFSILLSHASPSTNGMTLILGGMTLLLGGMTLILLGGMTLILLGGMTLILGGMTLFSL